MKLGREHALAAFFALVLLVGGVWVALNTEWVDVQVPDRLKGPALLDPDHRLKQFATRLGAQVTSPPNLEQMPPPGATLALSSSDWNLLPGRAARLRAWVEAGGHLWLPYQNALGDGLDWIPVQRRKLKRAGPAAPAASAASAASPATTSPDYDDDEEDDAPPPPRAGVAPTKPRCPGVQEPAHLHPAFGTARRFETCLYAIDELVPTTPPQWALEGPRGLVVARVPVGRGSVTVTSAYMPWTNQELLRSDHAEVAAATLRLGPGQTLWFVQDEARPPLLSFVWSNGRPAVLLFAAALAFALWRAAVRFGPWLAPLPSARRSVAEQIRGTAEFIQHHGGSALHAAQLRALVEAARARLQGYDALMPDDRAAAIAAATRLDAPTLARAMAIDQSPAARRHPSAALSLLETARRRLLERAALSSSGSR